MLHDAFWMVQIKLAIDLYLMFLIPRTFFIWSNKPESSLGRVGQLFDCWNNWSNSYWALPAPPPIWWLASWVEEGNTKFFLQAFYSHNDELILLIFFCQLLTKIPTLTTSLEATVDPPFVAFVNNDFHEQVVASWDLLFGHCPTCGFFDEWEGECQIDRQTNV